MNKQLIQNKIDEIGYVNTATILNMGIEDFLQFVGSDFKTFNDLEFTNIDEFYGGIKSKMMFGNGYGVSVVKHKYSYGFNLGLYEMAILDTNGEIVYDTPITNDVLGYLKPSDITEYMVKVQEL